MPEFHIKPSSTTPGGSRGKSGEAEMGGRRRKRRWEQRQHLAEGAEDTGVFPDMVTAAHIAGRDEKTMESNSDHLGHRDRVGFERLVT